MSPAEIVEALRGHARANGGMAALAKATGLHRATLYRTLAPAANPSLTTLLRLCKALDLQLEVSRPKAKKQKTKPAL